MELNTWNVQEYEITDGDGDVAVILFRPLTHGWRTRHLEISLNLQRAAEVADDAQKGAESAVEGEEVSSGRIEALLKAQGEAERSISAFREGLFGDLVVGSRNLTINGEEPDMAGLLQAILALEDLAEGLAAHILRHGQLSESEGKD